MDYNRPRCGDYAEHDEHFIPGTDNKCPGYSAEESAVVKMCQAVQVFVRQYRQLAEDIPSGAEIRMGPYTLHALLRNLVPDFSRPLIPLDKVYGLPVKIVPGMPLGRWEIIATSGEVPD